MKLFPPDASPGARMGSAIAIEGGLLVAGGWTHSDPTANSGVAYIFERNPEGGQPWKPVQILKPPGNTGGAEFGFSVAISDGRIVVGARGIRTAFIYERAGVDPEPWQIVAEVVDSGGRFGDSIDLDGDRLVVGDFSENGSTGAAYAYERNQGGPDQWGLVERLEASDGGTGDSFGTAVTVAGDTIVVGASVADDKGAAYVYEWSDALEEWEEVKKLSPTEGTFQEFGEALSLDDDVLVVGAERDDVDGELNAGAAYVYERDEGGADQWGEVVRLVASDAAESDHFGHSVGIDGDTIVAGAPDDDDLGFDTGALYVFQRDEQETWVETQKLLPNVEFTAFGASSAVSGSTVVGGAPGDITVANLAGAAYTYLLGPTLWSSGACPGQATFGVAGATANNTLVFGWSVAEGETTFASGPCTGTMVDLLQPRKLGELPTDADGEATISFNLPPLICGFWLQAVDEASCAVSNPLQLRQ